MIYGRNVPKSAAVSNAIYNPGIIRAAGNHSLFFPRIIGAFYFRPARKDGEKKGSKKTPEKVKIWYFFRKKITSTPCWRESD